MTSIFKTFFLLIVITQLIACFDLSPSDRDGDGVADNKDDFPDDPTRTIDWDGDGVDDKEDAFPRDSTEQYDSDSDGYGDLIDQMDDDPTEWQDADNDGYGDIYESKYIANAGVDITTVTGLAISIDGNLSESPDEVELDFEWRFIDIPITSDVTFNTNFEAEAEFVADVVGKYEVLLTTNHTLLKTRVDSIVINVKEDIEVTFAPITPEEGISICELTGSVGNWHFENCQLTAIDGSEMKISVANNRPDKSYLIKEITVFYDDDRTIKKNFEQLSELLPLSTIDEKVMFTEGGLVKDVFVTFEGEDEQQAKQATETASG